MLKRLVWIIGIVVVANAAALVVVARNGRGTDASLQLTERELPLTNLGTDTTGMTLTLLWDRETPTPWFDRAKLESVGFDCSMPPEAPGASEHYSGPWMLPRTAFVAFEYDPASIAADSQQAPPIAEPQPSESTPGGQPGGRKVTEYRSHLRPVDVDNNAQVLRARHPDAHRYLISAGVVRPRLVRAAEGNPARLEGTIIWVDPAQVYVPQEMQAIVIASLGKDSNTQPDRKSVV